jgi:colanic acid/amylovoran biosynthesis glycosyltransferase
MSSSKLMRVGYILKRYPRYSETFIVNEIIAHERAGLAIDIYSLRYPEDQHFQDIIAQVQAPVRYVPSDGARSNSFWSMVRICQQCLPRFWSSLEAASNEDGRDVYQAMIIASEATKKETKHFHAHFASKAATIARIASRFMGISYTLTAHAKDIFQEDLALTEVQANLAGAATVITVSDFNVDYLQRTYGVDRMKIRRIYNGLDLDRFPFETPEERPPAIVAVGRLVEKKGFSDLIEACSLLGERKVVFDCSIIGTGPLESELRGQIESLCLQKKVKLLGPLPQKEVIRCVQGAAVMAVPCIVASDEDKDGLPTVLIEAMALGTPCVSTDVTGIPEIVIDGETGLTVPQHDPPRLASALDVLLTQPGLRTKLSGRARKLIEDEFDISHNSIDVKNVFQEAYQAKTEILQGIR